MKLQPKPLQLQTVTRKPVSYPSGLAQQERQRVSGSASDLAATLREQASATISPNKRSVVDRLITLWAEGALG